MPQSVEHGPSPLDSDKSNVMWLGRVKVAPTPSHRLQPSWRVASAGLSDLRGCPGSTREHDYAALAAAPITRRGLVGCSAATALTSSSTGFLA
jgi:hypothetical protein